MLERSRIEQYARRAARVAYFVLGLDCRYSLALVEKPDIGEDALLDTRRNQIQLNLALLKPFSTEVMPSDEPATEEGRVLDENYRHMMKILYLVFYEMRQLYQMRVVEAYVEREKYGPAGRAPVPEDDETCVRWLEELKAPGPDRDISDDADAFAYYLTCRYPETITMLESNGRLAEMKRRYDAVELPKERSEVECFTIDTSEQGRYVVYEDLIINSFIGRERISKGRMLKNHYEDAEGALYCAWILSEGKCRESVAAFYHTEEDLEKAPSLELVLDALERMLDKLTDQDYGQVAAAVESDKRYEVDDIRHASELMDIYYYISELRDGRYYENEERYGGRRGIPRISTTGRRLLDTIMDLVWRMDAGGPTKDDEMYAAFSRVDDSWMSNVYPTDNK